MSKINKLLDVWKKLGFRVGTRQVGYKVVEYLSLKINYDKWIKNNEPTAEELEKQRAHKFKKQPKISIVIPMYKTDEGFFKELIDCFKAQTYGNWELCLADGSPSENPEFAKICAGDKRIVYKYLGRPGGISDNTNEGLKMVTGDFVAFMDHDDLIPVFSLYEIVKAVNEHEKVDYIYTDEDKIMDGHRFNPHFKPDYAPETLMCQNYISHFTVVRKNIADKIGGLKKQYDGAQDFDFTMNAIDISREVVHIPKVLYHWRVCDGSTAQSMDNKTYAVTAGLKATTDYLTKKGYKVDTKITGKFGVYSVQYLPKKKYQVAIIAPNQTQRLLDSIKKHAKYENYEIVESVDEIKKKADYIIYLGGDQEIQTDNFIEKLIGFFENDGIDIVSAKLLNKDGNLISAGLTVINGKVERRLANHNGKLLWYFGKGDIAEDVLAIEPDCYAIRANLYDAKKDIFNVCVTSFKNGQRIMITPEVETIVYDHQVSSIKTSNIQDTCYNPNFKNANFVINPNKIK